jgi:hypothetical protein
MDIELIAGNKTSNQSVLQNHFLKLFFNAPLANGYRVELQKNDRVELPASPIGYLLLSVGPAVIDYRTIDHAQHRVMKGGHYIWVDPGEQFSFTSQANTSSSFVLLQLK